MRRAQSGIELAVLFSFLLLLLIILSFEAANRASVVSRNRDVLEAEKIGDLAATHINIATSVGHGYSAKFYLPYGLTNSNFSIQIYSELQLLDIVYGPNYTRSFQLLTSNVTGVPKQGPNIINNTNGEIIIV